MRLDLNQLPADVALLQRLVKDLSAHLQRQDNVLQHSQQELKNKMVRIEHLEHQLSVLRHFLHKFLCVVLVYILLYSL